MKLSEKLREALELMAESPKSELYLARSTASGQEHWALVGELVAMGLINCRVDYDVNFYTVSDKGRKELENGQA